MFPIWSDQWNEYRLCSAIDDVNPKEYGVQQLFLVLECEYGGLSLKKFPVSFIIFVLQAHYSLFYCRFKNKEHLLFSFHLFSRSSQSTVRLHSQWLSLNQNSSEGMGDEYESNSLSQIRASWSPWRQCSCEANGGRSYRVRSFFYSIFQIIRSVD